MNWALDLAGKPNQYAIITMISLRWVLAHCCGFGTFLSIGVGRWSDSGPGALIVPRADAEILVSNFKSSPVAFGATDRPAMPPERPCCTVTHASAGTFLHMTC
jgi:hypothetical protein